MVTKLVCPFFKDEIYSKGQKMQVQAKVREFTRFYIENMYSAVNNFGFRTLRQYVVIVGSRRVRLLNRTKLSYDMLS